MNFFCFGVEVEIKSDIAGFTFNAYRSSSAVNQYVSLSHPTEFPRETLRSE